MTPDMESRTRWLEQEIVLLRGRVTHLEREVLAARPVARPARPAPTPPAPRQAPPRPKKDLEALVGARLLPYAGAIAVLLGVAFFVAVAIGRGWLGESARIALAYAGSAALVAAGAWLHER